VTESSLRFGYSFGITSQTVSRSRIRSVQVVPHVRGLHDWGGWGIRLNASCTWQKSCCRSPSHRRETQPDPFPFVFSFVAVEWGYISKNGPGIRVTLAQTQASSSRPSPTTKTPTTTAETLVSYTFLCDDAERVAKILSSSIESRSSFTRTS
jgi:hypothetical protein